eukprot:7382654-Prymnesium_polylepis.1
MPDQPAAAGEEPEPASTPQPPLHFTSVVELRQQVSRRKGLDLNAQVDAMQNTKHRCTERALICAHTAGGFCCVIFVLVPATVMAISFAFASILYSIECNSVQAEDLPSDDDMCSVYEWFKYIVGNLVGLATPLTDVSP